MKIQAQNFYNCIYRSNFLKSTLLSASQNSALFAASASFVMGTVLRPLAISKTPSVEEENKKYAIAKSLSTGLIGLGLTYLVSKPFSDAIKNIDNSPKEFLKEDTINFLKNGEKSLLSSKKYGFATQLFKLGLGFFLAAPKSFISSKLIKPFLNLNLFEENKSPKNNVQSAPNNPKKYPAFKGSTEKLYKSYTNILSDKIGKIIDSKPTQNLVNKFYNKDFEQYMMSAPDIVTTGLFILNTMKNKDLDEKRKRVLSFNSGLSTLFSVTGGLALSKMLDKPLDKFIQNFNEANKNSPDFILNSAKYAQGAKIIKSTLALGTIYYVLIPVISTFLSEKIENKLCQNFISKSCQKTNNKAPKNSI